MPEQSADTWFFGQGAVPVEIPRQDRPNTAESVGAASPGVGQAPSEAATIPPGQWATVPLALALVALVAWRGMLTSRRLRLGPVREVPLTWLDLGAGLMMWLGGQIVAVAVLQSSAGTGVLTDGSPAAVAVRTVVIQLAGFGPPALWFVLRCSHGQAGLRRGGLIPRRPGRDLAWALLALPVAVILVLATMTVTAAVATALGHPPSPVQHDLLNTYTEPMTNIVFALLLISTVVLAPVLEEVIWRGLLQTVLLQAVGPDRRWTVILSAAVLFGLIHVSAAALTALPALILLGVVFGYLYERTGSLWPGILVHAGFNAFNVAVVMAGAAGPTG